jgi:hypothetical protein
VQVHGHVEFLSELKVAWEYLELRFLIRPLKSVVV